MGFQPHRLLGLAMEDRAVLAVEVRVSGQKKELLRAAEFTIPQDASLDDPQHFGRALRDFLRSHHFSSRAAVIGVPARWLLSTERVFPPAKSNSLAGMVRLEAERSFATDIDHLSVDYSEGLASDKDVRVLVTAVASRRVDELRAMSQTAGLKLKALVPTSLVFAAALRANVPSGLLLLLRPNHVEVVIQDEGRFRAIRHLPVPPLAAGPQAAVSAEWTRALAHGVLRLVTLMPQNHTDPALGNVVIWDGIGLAPDGLQELAESLGSPATSVVHLEDLGIASVHGKPEEAGERFAGAVALALAGGRGGGFPVNFLDSRLKERRKQKDGRRLTWVAVAVVAALVALGVYLFDWHQEEKDLAGLNAHLKDLKADIADAADVLEKVTIARRWTDKRPRFLEPLRELSLTLPAQARLWVTSLAMRQELSNGAKQKSVEPETVREILDHVKSVTDAGVQNRMHVVVSGKSADEGTVLDLLDRIRRSPAFDPHTVKLLYMRGASGNSSEVAFSMTFDLVMRN